MLNTGDSIARQSDYNLLLRIAKEQTNILSQDCRDTRLAGSTAEPQAKSKQEPTLIIPRVVLLDCKEDRLSPITTSSHDECNLLRIH